jgi:hypothetical protein
MARAYLSVQSTSVSVERWFSDGVDLITPTRSSLSEDSISTVMELKQMLDFGGEDLFSFILQKLNVNDE